MKQWQKGKKEDIGETLLSWQHKATQRFFMKIGTWLLTGFVAGILASIIMATINQANAAQFVARFVFWLVFISGTTSSYYRNIHNGLEYRISEKALVSVKPVCGIVSIDKWLNSINSFFQQRIFYIPWKEIDELKDENGTIIVNLKNNRGSFELGVSPILSLTVQENKTSTQHDSKDLDKESIRLILQKARDAKRQHNSA